MDAIKVENFTVLKHFKGSDIHPSQCDFIPPLLSLITNANWENENEFPYLYSSLELLIENGALDHSRYSNPDFGL